MKMVSSAKLGAFQKYLPYTRSTHEFLRHCLSWSAAEIDPAQWPFFARPRGASAEGHLLVVIGADRGLCGGYNTQINRCVDTFLRHHQEEHGAISAIGYGIRAVACLHKFSVPVVESYTMGAGPTIGDAEHFVTKLLDLWKTGTYRKVSLIYTRFMNVMRQEVTLCPLLPLDADHGHVLNSSPLFPKGAWPLLEPSPGYVCEAAGRMVLVSWIYEALLESFLSEQGARMTAMDTATRNGEEALKKLNLLYNRKRQSLITNEIIEVIAGASL
jgi:F-type H+-transporting ATPase subunit gamma